MDFFALIMAVIGLAVGAGAGIFGYTLSLRAKANAKLRMPETWPLTTRGIFTSEELEVLQWLRTTFGDHLIMAKLPVLRFTTPTAWGDGKVEGEKWLDVLNGVYCTFTICNANGKIVGCVDVPGKRGQTKANRDVKESLLSDCGIPYTAVRSTLLPKSSAMRAAFLGEIEEDDQIDMQETRGGDSSFHADLDAFTKHTRKAAKEAALRELKKNTDVKPQTKPVPAGFNPDGTGAFATRKPSRFPTHWEDSFTQPSESRPARLGEG